MLWSSIESLSLAGVSFVMLVLLARYLDAASFGRAALALGIAQIASSFAESFFHDAVVQRRGLERQEIDAAHTASVLTAVLLVIGIVTYAVVARADPVLEGGVSVAELALWMTPSILLSSWNAMPVAQLRRQLSMRQLATATAGSRLVAGIVATVGLTQGLGVWALVLNQNLAALGLLLLLRFVHAPTAGLTRNLAPARGLARYAAVNSISGLLNANMSRFFQLASGLVLPAAVVGQLSLALRMVEMLVSVLVTGVARVTLSRLSASLHAGLDVAASFLATTRKVCIFLVPTLVLLAVVAQPLVTLVGRQGWEQAASLVAWFALAQAVRSPTFLANALFMSLGQPKLSVLVSVTELATLALLTWALQSPLAWIARLVVVLPLVLMLLQRRGHIDARALLRQVRQPFLAAALMGGVLVAVLTRDGLPVVSPLIGMLASLAGGAILYAVALACLGTGPKFKSLRDRHFTRAKEAS